MPFSKVGEGNGTTRNLVAPGLNPRITIAGTGNRGSTKKKKKDHRKRETRKSEAAGEGKKRFSRRQDGFLLKFVEKKKGRSARNDGYRNRGKRG